MLLQDRIVVVSEFVFVVLVVILALVSSSFGGSSSVRLGFGGESVVVVGRLQRGEATREKQSVW